MGAADVELVWRIYGFDWVGVGSRREGFEELADLVNEDFSSQLSPELGERVMTGVGALRDFTVALESDFSEFRYDADEIIAAEDGMVVVLGTIQASGRSSRMPLSGEFGHVWSIRDGKASTVTAYREHATARERAGL